MKCRSNGAYLLLAECLLAFANQRRKFLILQNDVPALEALNLLLLVQRHCLPQCGHFFGKSYPRFGGLHYPRVGEPEEFLFVDFAVAGDIKGFNSFDGFKNSTRRQYVESAKLVELLWPRSSVHGFIEHN